jgi:hypothetical protein
MKALLLCSAMVMLLSEAVPGELRSPVSGEVSCFRSDRLRWFICVRDWYERPTVSAARVRRRVGVVTDWNVVASLATAGGTLVLGIATFASVRSANRAARTAERSLLEGLRPLLVTSRMQDPPEKIGFVDQHWVRVAGGHGSIEATDTAIYLTIALRNVGRGMAVLHGWYATPGASPSNARPDHAPVSDFRRLTRDLYVPPNDLGFWQGALRDPTEPDFEELCATAKAGEPITIELLYGDQAGGQRAISRFSLFPHETDGQQVWLAAVSRHWHLDREAPR